MRRRILGYLGTHGSANSTAVARALGESTGTTSYHLRKLAEQRLVEEIPERSTGRERWWRAAAKDLRHAPPSALTLRQRALAEEFHAIRMSDDLEILTRAYAEYGTSDGWVQGLRGGTFMTKDELLAFVEEYNALLWKYGHDADDKPAGARHMALRFVAVPQETSGVAEDQEHKDDQQHDPE